MRVTILGQGLNLAKIILIFSLLITQNYVVLYIKLKHKKYPTLYISLQPPHALTLILFFSSLWVPSSMPLSSLFYIWPSSSLASFLPALMLSLSPSSAAIALMLSLSPLGTTIMVCLLAMSLSSIFIPNHPSSSSFLAFVSYIPNTETQTS